MVNGFSTGAARACFSSCACFLLLPCLGCRTTALTANLLQLLEFQSRFGQGDFREVADFHLNEL